MQKDLVTTLLFLALLGYASAETYYSDPVNGNTATGDGSAEYPWGTLESAVAAGKLGSQQNAKYIEGTVKAGDTVKLKTGYHGVLGLYGLTPTDYITIEADTGATPELAQIVIKASSYWKFKGLKISPDLASPSLVVNRGGVHPGIVYGYADNHIIIEDSNIFTVDDSSVWTEPNDWRDYSWNGYYIQDGENSIIRNNRIRNVTHGIVFGHNALIENNIIDGFSVDALNGNGGSSIIQDNIITNVYDDNANTHSDGFQIGAKGEVNNLTFRRNYINAWTGTNPSPSARGTTQGIFLESFLKNSRIENNVVIATSQSWGIAPGGNVENVVIANNTVLNLYGKGDNTPISLPHGNPGSIVIGRDLREYYCVYHHTADSTNEPGVGTRWRKYWVASGNTGSSQTWVSGTYYNHGFYIVRNVTIRNNIASRFPPDSNNPPSDKGLSWENVQVDHNYDIDNYGPNIEFVDYDHGNVRLRTGSHFIDAGSSLDAPAEDLDRNSRPRGQGYDVGAYEYISSTPPPPPPPSILYGDVSGDSAVNLSDALMAAQSSVGLITLNSDQTKKGDVNGNGQVTAYDAALILQKIAGLISKFPVE